METGRGGGWLSQLRGGKLILILLMSFGLLGFLLLWSINSNFGNRGFRAILMVSRGRGIKLGMPVTYREVKVGKVIGIAPEPQGVAVEVEIWPADRLIPSDSLIKFTREDGENVIDLTPLKPLPSGGVIAKPLAPNCDRKIILCNDKRLQNQGIGDLNLIGTIHAIQYVNTAVQDIDSSVQDINTRVKDINTSVQDVAKLTQDANELLVALKKSNSLEKINSTLTSVQQAAANISQAAQKISKLSDTATGLLESARQTNTVGNLNSTLVSVGGAAEQIRLFMAINQRNLSNTLVNLEQLSQELTLMVRQLKPNIQQIGQGKILANLETIAANTAELTANLRNFSAKLNDPQTSLELQKILDSARSVFENLNKVLSDTDELTGNPKFRRDLLRLIEGLTNLLSSTQLLQRQVEYAQLLNQVAVNLDRPAKARPQGNVTP